MLWCDLVTSQRSENKGKRWGAVIVDQPDRMKGTGIGDIPVVVHIDSDVNSLELILEV